MSFPLNPVNGQQSTVNGISYTYSSSSNSWTRTQKLLPILSISVDTFTGNGVTTTFTLSTTPYSKELVTVNIDGVLQQKSAYNIASNILSLTGTPINGAVIEVKVTNASPVSVLTGLTFDSFTGTGSTTDFILSTVPTNKNYTIVTIGGVTQQKANYNIADNVLTFTTAPPATAPIEVTTFGPAASSTLAAGSNTHVQFNSQNLMGSSSNLTFNSQTNTLAVPNITATNIVGTTITANVVGNVTGNVTGSVSTVSSADQANITSLGTLSSLTVTGTTTLQLASDIIKIKAGATGVVTHDLSTSGVFYHTGPAANFTANFINVPITNERALMSTLLINQGATPYLPTAVQIEGAAQTIKWIYSTVPTGVANKVDVVSFSLIRTSDSWQVLGSAGTYG